MSPTVTITIAVTVPAVKPFSGESARDFRARLRDTAARYVRAAIHADNRLTLAHVGPVRTWIPGNQQPGTRGNEQ